MLKLREVSTGAVFVQARGGEYDLLTYAKHAEVERFYTDEIDLRKHMGYPPFMHFIHLTWQGTHEEVKKTEAHVHELLDPWNINIYQSSFTPKDSVILHGLIRTDEATWPDAKLTDALKRVLPHVRIVHNPDRII